MQTLVKLLAAVLIGGIAFIFAFDGGERIGEWFFAEPAPTEFTTTFTLDDPAMDVTATTSVPELMADEMAREGAFQDNGIERLRSAVDRLIDENCAEADDKSACIEGLDFTFAIFD